MSPTFIEIILFLIFIPVIIRIENSSGSDSSKIKTMDKNNTFHKDDGSDESKKASLLTVFPQTDKSKEITTTPPPEREYSECDCTCRRIANRVPVSMIQETRSGEVDMSKREKQLHKEFEEKMQFEIAKLTERFDFILNNEQLRASYMLAEAHRERHEVVKAVQTLLECKNLTGMMYVMCSERTKAKLDKLRVVEEYKDFIDVLLKILEEAQALILKLSKGYKTAARVEREWQDKVKILVKEFQAFINHYTGALEEQNQFYFDVPKLLQTRASLEDDPQEDPIETASEDMIKAETPHEKRWYEELGSECPPFIMFGDLEGFEPDPRREVVRRVKAAKTAPKKWKEYVFDEMRLNTKCVNLEQIKHQYQWNTTDATTGYGACTANNANSPTLESRRITTVSLENIGMGSLVKFMCNNSIPVTKATLLGARDSLEVVTQKIRKSQQELPESEGSVVSAVKINPRMRRTSFAEGSAFYEFEPDPPDDNSFQGLKPTPASTKNDELQQLKEMDIPSLTQLSRMDSLEMATSRTIEVTHDKVHHEKPKSRQEVPESEGSVVSAVKMNPKMRRTSFVEGSAFYEFEPDPPDDNSLQGLKPTAASTKSDELQQPKELDILSHMDSLELATSRQSRTIDMPHDKVHHAKICPVEKCKLMHMDSFIHSLPSYMKAAPFTQFLSSYENYEACTPEQLEILKQRIEEKKGKKKKPGVTLIQDSQTTILTQGQENIFEDWQEQRESGGIAVQTSDMSMPGYTPCTCRDPPVSEVSSERKVYKFDDLIPVKAMINEITKKCFYDDEIEFNRFKLVGQRSASIGSRPSGFEFGSTPTYASTPRDHNATTKVLASIRSTLKKHPSLAELFQHGPS